MKPLPHRYDVTLSGGAAGYAALSAPGVPELIISRRRHSTSTGPGMRGTPKTCCWQPWRVVSSSPCARSPRPRRSTLSRSRFRPREPSTGRTASRASRRLCFGRDSPCRRAQTTATRCAFWNGARSVASSARPSPRQCGLSLSSWLHDVRELRVPGHLTPQRPETRECPPRRWRSTCCPVP